MSENKNNKNISLESQDTAADEIASSEANEVSKQGKKSFGRKV